MPATGSDNAIIASPKRHTDPLKTPRSAERRRWWRQVSWLAGQCLCSDLPGFPVVSIGSKFAALANGSIQIKECFSGRVLVEELEKLFYGIVGLGRDSMRLKTRLPN